MKGSRGVEQLSSSQLGRLLGQLSAVLDPAIQFRPTFEIPESLNAPCLVIPGGRGTVVVAAPPLGVQDRL